MSYNEMDRFMDKEISNKHYISNKHILLHLKTHLHRIKDGEESLLELITVSPLKNLLHTRLKNQEELEVRRQSKTRWLLILFCFRFPTLLIQM